MDGMVWRDSPGSATADVADDGEEVKDAQEDAQETCSEANETRGDAQCGGAANRNLARMP